MLPWGAQLVSGALVTWGGASDSFEGGKNPKSQLAEFESGCCCLLTVSS